MTRRFSIIVLNFLLVIFLLPVDYAFAYKRDTHDYLAREAANLFNFYYPELKINENFIEKIAIGARDEDNLSRPLYHFYDPINNLGLRISGKEWLSAKKWAVDSQSQLALKPFFSLANIFSKSNTETNFTWHAAIERYKSGDKNGAFYTLGHVLHLIQDMAVPDHTRNDQHADGSPYEKFAHNIEINDLNGKPIVLDNLGDYFDRLATYSNNNFYSRDTIGLVEYKLPQPDYQIYIDGYYYGVKVDELGTYYLSRKSNGSLLFANSSNITIDDPLVLESYWSRLAPKAVQYGAGLIKIFLDEINEENIDAKNYPVESQDNDIREKLTAQAEAAAALNSEKIHKIENLIDKVNQIIGNLTPTQTVMSPAISQIPQTSISQTVSQSGSGQTNNQSEAEITVGTETEGEVKEIENENISLAVSRFLFDAAGPDGGQEFIELCNLGNKEASLEGWSIQTTGKKKNFEAGNRIAPGGNFLIWLGDNPEADMAWKSGSLKNSTDAIYLVSSTQIISGDNDPAIVNSYHYDQSQMPGFEPGMIIVVNSSCAGNKDYGYKPYQPNAGGFSGELEDWNITNLYFYSDPNNQGHNLVDIHFKNYPLINGKTGGWKALVFYKNQEPLAADEFLETAGDWLPENFEGLLSISYPNYSGDTHRHSLILPDDISHYGSQGGLHNVAFKYEILIEDNLIRLKTADQADYLTVAIYDFYQSGGGNQSLKLAMLGTTKFFWQEDPPLYSPPVINGDPALVFDDNKSQAVVSWPRATDSDSLDNLITYNIKLNGNQENTSATERRFVTNPGDSLSFSIKAADEFGNFSEEKLLVWNYPKAELFFEQNNADGWGSAFGSKNPNCPSCESSVSEFELKPAANFLFNFISVRLLHAANAGWPADVRLRVYSETEDLIATKVMTGIINPDSTKDLTFIFNEDAKLEAGKKYKLVLDVEKYSDNRAFYESAFKNAISNNGEWYLKVGLIEK